MRTEDASELCFSSGVDYIFRFFNKCDVKMLRGSSFIVMNEYISRVASVEDGVRRSIIQNNDWLYCESIFEKIFFTPAQLTNDATVNVYFQMHLQLFLYLLMFKLLFLHIGTHFQLIFLKDDQVLSRCKDLKALRPSQV